MESRNQRKTLIVDGRVQARIVALVSFPMFACLALAIAGEFAYHHAVRTGALPSDGTILGMPENRLGMLLLFVSMATVQLVTGLIASQRVAGVAYHIRRVLTAYRSGDRHARVRLRKGDFQLELGDDVNGFLEWLEKHENAAAEPDAANRPAKSTAGPPSRAARTSAPMGESR